MSTNTAITSITKLVAPIGIAGLVLGTASAQTKVDERLPAYEPSRGVSGTITSVGSDTMNNLMTLWTEAFKRHYPNVQPEIEGAGSSTAPPALISGGSTFGPMSRPMKAEEIDEFKKAFGYEPVGLPTSIDMLAVYVNKDNPIAEVLGGLTLQQVDAIFSKSRNGGYPRDIKTWGDLGLGGEWADQPISMYGRNSSSGTYGYFKSKALFKGDYKDSVKEQPGSSSVIQGVASDKFAIGYSGIGYKTADVIAVPLALDAGEDHVAPAVENTSEYPLARFLFLYVNYKPNSELDPLRAEFVKFVFSAEGQRNVVDDGYFPVTAEIAKRALTSVGLSTKALEAAMARPGGE